LSLDQEDFALPLIRISFSHAIGCCYFLHIGVSWHVKSGDGIRVFIYPRFDPNRKSSCR
jgi:hypothetical protein